MQMQRHVLVSGAAGFTGRYLTDELRAHGYRVSGFGSQADSGEAYHRVDLADTESLATLIARLKPDYVVHLAARAFVQAGDANAFYETNLIGTRNLLEALAASGHSLECVLLASSANVYGNATPGMLRETAQPQPANDYAVSKLAMEHMARLWFERLPIVIARPFNYTGVGQAEHFLLPKIVAHFSRKVATIELGNLDVWRDFSDVRAVVKAYRGLLETKPLGETFNVCSGQAHSLREVLALCTALCGHAVQVEVNPGLVRTNEVRILCGDGSKLGSLLPQWQTPALEETLRWMLEQAR